MEYRHNFRALQAFEAVARHASVSRAAEELGVTQSAISHQLRLLADLVGEKLLRKEGRGIALTPAGEVLARKLQPAFAAIDRSVLETIGQYRDTVRLAVCSSFGPGWLIPRLPTFYASNPAFDLQLCMYARDPELTDAVADAFVTTLPVERGFFSHLLWPEKLVPVVSATRRHDEAPPLVTTDLQQGRVGADWRTYARLSGRHEPGANDAWLLASHYILALEMVRADLGAALVPDFLVADELSSGKLRLLGDVAIPTHEDYYFCVKESRRHEPALDSLARWFKAQVNGASDTARASCGSK